MKNFTHGGDIYSHQGEKILDFSANINPLGLPGAVRQAIADNIDTYTNYPDPLCRELKHAISKHEHIPESYIVCGNGAADLIFRIALCQKPKKALILAPTFSEYEEALRLCDCQIAYHFLLEKNRFAVEESAFESISPALDMMFICNPNNPTGIPIQKDFMLKLANRCKEYNIILVVDECFADFLEDESEYSLVSHLAALGNVIVLKAFTKIYAMAGIRLGYALCGDSLCIDRLHATGQPWSVSTVAAKCGVAALVEREYLLKTKELIARNRAFLMDELQGLGIDVFESKANYVFFKCKTDLLVEKLKKFHILIRCCGNFVGLEEGYYRIAVKNEEDNRYFIQCLRDILK